ncbi:MAG: electron transport complex protein RnfC [Lachnospiraceae bacterium]|nr:electron transport complex protein RnfC [Lachnospiraceae bacterium]MCI9058686.1 electron transport complex protein RnfC [Lachnospiraceae bacterium]
MQENLTALVESAGIVGAGGAGFPTHVKLNAKADTVIINGAECEPLLRVDQQLMAGQAGRLLAALDKIVAHLGAEEGVVALKEHYHTAAEALQRELANYPKLRLHLLGAFYPAGDEQVIVYEVTGRIVPEGGIPINVGVVVTNVETALNVLDAADGHPVTDKYVTVTGAVRGPKTVKVPLGITVAEALELAGGPTVPDYRIVNGGPMMGRLVSPESVITKTTKGLIVVPAGHPLLNSLERPLNVSLRQAAAACMQCSLCSEVCPRGLLGHRIQPHKLMRLTAYGSMCDPAQTPMNAYLCCGCRLCEYACVMGLQPWKLNGNLKNILGSQGIRNSLNSKPEQGAPFREYKRFPVHKLIHQLGLAAYDVDAPLEETALPAYAKVTLPLRQNVGAPAEPAVQTGSQVQKGDLIARIPEGKLGANLHASISGTVTAVSDDSIVIQA